MWSGDCYGCAGVHPVGVQRVSGHGVRAVHSHGPSVEGGAGSGEIHESGCEGTEGVEDRCRHCHLHGDIGRPGVADDQQPAGDGDSEGRGGQF